MVANVIPFALEKQSSAPRFSSANAFAFVASSKLSYTIIMALSADHESGDLES
jgi:hypothetical protein